MTRFGLTHVRIRGFRSAREVAFEPGPLCALVGEAGSGKSNVLSAIWRLLALDDRPLDEADLTGGRKGRLVIEGAIQSQALSFKGRPGEPPVRSGEPPSAGQVNGLSILDLGDHAFGRPTRVTAQASVGRGNVLSIEREIELSGPIHSKGFLILSGYLAGKYAQVLPLALQATITFEQSYDEVEGDSASSTERYALLSALSGLPLKQGIAITGSVGQHGEVQAVGGVTRKIEGFFATCQAKGLTGEQGVIIPRANLPNLMLRDDVVDAVRAGEFHVWAVETIDEGIELLTGCPAGARRSDGSYAEGTVNALVSRRLEEYADRLRVFASTDGASASRV